MMGKYTHMNESEIVSHVRKFGTEDEQEILSKIVPILDYEDCPNCEDRDAEIDELKSKISEAKTALE